jgi:DUF971 family protein
MKFLFAACHTEGMRQPSPAAPAPTSVKVHMTAGTGVDILWSDGHTSHYSFQFLRDACPCALCDEERTTHGREPGQPPAAQPGALPMFRQPVKPTQAEQVGKYALRFTWSDGHLHGIYSWDFLRDVCPCEECKGKRALRQR